MHIADLTARYYVTLSASEASRRPYRARRNVSLSPICNLQSQLPPIHLGLEHTDIGQVTVTLGIIETVAYHKLVRNIEA